MECIDAVEKAPPSVPKDCSGCYVRPQASPAFDRSVVDFALSAKTNRCDLDNEIVIRRSEWANLNQRWPRGLLVSIDLINSFVVGISGGEILSARKPISNSVGITSSRPASSPQIVTGFPEASPMMMPSKRSIDGWVSS
jgi:hypothetical protein